MDSESPQNSPTAQQQEESVKSESEPLGESVEDNSSRTGGGRSKRYAKIDDESRKAIIFEVIHLGSSVRAVSHKLGVNMSSAKNVISIYKKEGRIEKKKNRFKAKQKEHQAFEQMRAQTQFSPTALGASIQVPTDYRIEEEAESECNLQIFYDIESNSYSASPVYPLSSHDYAVCEQVHQTLTGSLLRQ